MLEDPREAFSGAVNDPQHKAIRRARRHVQAKRYEAHEITVGPLDEQSGDAHHDVYCRHKHVAEIVLLDTGGPDEPFYYVCSAPELEYRRNSEDVLLLHFLNLRGFKQLADVQAAIVEILTTQTWDHSKTSFIPEGWF